MILLGPKTEIITHNTRGYTPTKRLKSSIVFDGAQWVKDVFSNLASYDLDIYKVTFSDGLSVLTSGDQKVTLKSGKVRSVNKLSKGTDLALGRFHSKSYYNPHYIETTDSKVNRVVIEDVGFYRKGILYSINGLGFNQNLCLSNGVLLQN